MFLLNKSLFIINKYIIGGFYLRYLHQRFLKEIIIENGSKIVMLNLKKRP
jgi:hypothetical protein